MTILTAAPIVWFMEEEQSIESVCEATAQNR